MSDDTRQALADLIRARRGELGISGRELARRAGIDAAMLWHFDQKRIADPKASTIQALANGLAIPVTDIYAAIQWLPEGDLPSLKPYMRAKYDDLPDEAVKEVELFVAWISSKYSGGPTASEDE